MWNPNTKLLAITLALFALILSACGTTQEASTEAAPAPITVTAEPAIEGYCPVAYVEAGQAVQGSPEFTAEHDGEVWYFVNAQARDMFVANPERYTVQYDGWCATAIAFGKKVPVDASVFTVHKGAIYLFSNAEAKAAFDADPNGFTERADTAWRGMASR